MVNDEVEEIRKAVSPLCEPLHDVFTWADQKRRKKLGKLHTHKEYAWHATHTIRAYAHRRLSKVELGPWSITGNHARNGELWLSDNSFRVRLLHCLRDADVPPPGNNLQRRAYYRNIPLVELEQEPLFGPRDDRLLFVWRIESKTGMPAFRVVRPIGNWKFGDLAKTDISFVLPETAADLAALRFIPSDVDMELDIPTEDDQEGGGENAGGVAG